jgi:hypothetical protein
MFHQFCRAGPGSAATGEQRRCAEPSSRGSADFPDPMILPATGQRAIFVVKMPVMGWLKWGDCREDYTLPTYLCHDCSALLGHSSTIAEIQAGGLGQINTQRQLDWFWKHTAPKKDYPVNSVFLDSSSTDYCNYMVSTIAAGCVEFDDEGRKNFILFAGSTTGLQFNNGVFESPCNGYKTVLTESSTTVHAFPTYFRPEIRICENCRKALPF